jgi:hypothetical protein
VKLNDKMLLIMKWISVIHVYIKPKLGSPLKLQNRLTLRETSIIQIRLSQQNKNITNDYRKCFSIMVL